MGGVSHTVEVTAATLTRLAPRHAARRKIQNMGTKYLDQLAQQLKTGKNAACCRAIERILAMMKKRYEGSEYSSRAEAERAFRKFVKDEPICQKVGGSKTNR